MQQPASLTQLLNAAAGGDRRAESNLLPMIYDELRGIARARLGRAHTATLQPTALVNEAYLRLFGDATPEWNSRGHFFAAAAQAMRNILVEHARRRASLKRGGDRKRVSEDDAWQAAIAPPVDDVLGLHEALSELERSDPHKSRLVLLHCFCGLSLAETAAALGVSLSTAEREWRFVRALLRTRLGDGVENSDGQAR